MNRKEDNQLLADFMGMVPKIKTPPALYDIGGAVVTAESMSFHYSLDTLKPVVDKLNTLQEDYACINNHFNPSISLFSDITTIYTTVVNCVRDVVSQGYVNE